MRVDPEDALRAAAESSLFGEVVAGTARRAEGSTPPLPLRLGHVALQLATGRLDGVVGVGEHRHVVKGRVVRQAVTDTDRTPEGEITTTHEVLGVEITALDAEGRVHTYASATEGGGGG
jgi:hypothetical protein